MSVKIYHIPNIQHVVYRDEETSIKLENNPLNRFNTILYKGSVNTIDFTLRDRDRKPINLLDKTLTLNISEIETRTSTLTKILEQLDQSKGFARLTLTDAETFDMNEGFYVYSIVVTEDNGREGFAFVDQVFRVTGEFELRRNAIEFSPTVITVTTFIEDITALLGISDPGGTIFRSGGFNYGVGPIHTAAFYLTDFMGTIQVEVTTNQSLPTVDTDWAVVASFDTASLTSGPLSCIKYFNTNGLFTFVRFVYQPHALNTGTIDQVLYN